MPLSGKTRQVLETALADGSAARELADAANSTTSYTGSTVYGAAHQATVADGALTALTGSRRVYDLADYDGVGDGVTNNAAAFNAALNAMHAEGGTLKLPPGSFDISTAVSHNFSGGGSLVVIEGSGSDSVIGFKGGAGATNFLFSNCEQIIFRNVSFLGRTAGDDGTGIRFATCLAASFENCVFYNCAAWATAGVLRFVNSGAYICNTYFRGCTGDSGVGRGVIHFDDWKAIVIDGLQFIDFGTFNGTFVSKTAQAGAAWIVVGDPEASLTNAYAGTHLSIENIVMDEGAEVGILINPTTRRIAAAHIAGLASNVGLSTGVTIRNVNELELKHSWFGWSTTQKFAVRLEGCNHSVLERITCSQEADAIIADANCVSLTIRDSTYAALSSSAQRTYIIKDGEEAIWGDSAAAMDAWTLVKINTVTDQYSQLATTDSAALVAGITLDETTGVQGFRALVKPGQVVKIRSDGTTTITKGDALTTSTTVAGRVKKLTGASEMQIAIAQESIAATLNLTVKSLFTGPVGPKPAQGAANADTSGATLAQLETEVNEIKATLRTIGAIVS